MNDSRRYLSGAVLAVFGTAVILWLAAGVGIIGADGHPANRWFLLVPIVGVVAAVVRGGSRRWSFALLAMVVTHLAIAAVAVVLGIGADASPAAEVLGVTALTSLPLLAAAEALRRAGRSPRQS